MEFIKTFENNSDYVSYRDGGKYEIPNVSLSKDTKKVHYNLYANNHEYVDLGLPSGTLWATMNVGASSSGETGLYFQWGDTSGYTADQVGIGMGTDGKDSAAPAKVSKSMAIANNSASASIDTGTGGATTNSGIGSTSSGPGGFPDLTGTTKPGSGESYNKKPFSWSDYKWNPSGDGKTFTKYTVTGATLDLEDDAAHANWGGDWHMPTPDQMQELLDNTTSVWTTQDNVNGRLFTSKSDSSKSIFFPAAGDAWDGQYVNSGINGDIWTSMLSESKAQGKSFTFSSASKGIITGNRFNGFSVRGVIG